MACKSLHKTAKHCKKPQYEILTMSSCSSQSDQDQCPDQVALTEPGTNQDAELGRYSPSKLGPELLQQVEMSVSNDKEQPKLFNIHFEQAESEASDTGMQLEPPRLEPVLHERHRVQETNMATTADSATAASNTGPFVQIQQSWVFNWDFPDGVDPLENISRALGELCSAESLLRQEREEYKQKYTTLVETERETRVYYEDKLGDLEKQLEDLSEVKEEADRKHEQDEAIFRQTVEKHEKNYSKLSKKYKRQNSERIKIEHRFKAKQAEVEQLRESLRQKEKELQEMEEELTTKTAEVQELDRQTKVLVISQEKETTKEQLQRCQQIRELVERLPQLKTKEDREKITKQINDDIVHMRALTNRKFISWR